MKKIGRVLLCLLLVGFSLFLPVATADKVRADSGYVIEEYKVDVLVKKNGNYEIKETITVDFNMWSRGIYRIIPTYYRMEWIIDDVSYTRQYTFPVEKIKVNNKTNIEYRQYDVSIRIGDPDKQVFGQQTYEISYIMKTTDLKLNGMQKFYFNVIGTEWETTINRVEFNIRFEEGITYDTNHWFVYSGRKGSTEQWDSNDSKNQACHYSEQDFTITCFSNESLRPNEGITVQLDIDNSNPYFKFPDYSYLYYVSIAVSLIFLVVVILVYFFFGKSGEVIKPIEFTAPKGIDASGVGYIIDDKVDTRDIVALILEWAKDGHLRIDDSETVLKFFKLKELDEKAPSYQKNLFKALFRTGDEVTEKQLKGNFFDSIETAKKGVKEHFKIDDRLLFEKKSIALKYLMMALLWVPLAVAIVSLTMIDDNSIRIALVPLVIVTCLSCWLFGILISNWKTMKVALKVILIIVASVATIIYVSFLITVIIEYREKEAICTIIALTSTIVSLIVVGIMRKRTEFGLRVYGQVLGLFDFIKRAEESRMKLLVEENPQIFYDVLPYAYAFNMVKVWAAAFKNITLPEQDFYRTSGDFYPNVMFTRLNNSMVHLQTQVFTPPPPPSTGGVGGGSFGGGGFSGGSSGGGSSGGGFGGGGGGRW